MNRTALSITFERFRDKALARQRREADPHVRVELRLPPRIADALDAAAAASGRTIDEYVERMVAEAQS
jgi:hypothetical protein